MIIHANGKEGGATAVNVYNIDELSGTRFYQWARRPLTVQQAKRRAGYINQETGHVLIPASLLLAVSTTKVD